MLGKWELFAHQGISTLIIVVFSVALIVRVVWQKRTMARSIHWRKYRKMTIQLLSVSMLYLLLNSPAVSIVIATQFGLPQSVTVIPLIYILFFELILYFYFHLFVVDHYLNLEKNS